MIEFNLYGVVTTCFVGAFLLGIFNKQDDRQGWFSKVMIAGVLATLVKLLPSLHKGISLNWGICYFLIGVLILSTAISLGSTFFQSHIAQAAEVLRGIGQGSLDRVINSKFWGLTKQIFFGVRKVLFIVMVALWAIISYPARHPKTLALPPAAGEQLVF